MLFALYYLFANAPAPDAGGQAQQQVPGGGLFQFLPYIVLFVFAYLFLFRGPMKKQERERQALYASLKKNDRVLTSGGIIGTVASIKEKEDEVTIRVDDSSNVRLRMTKSSIVRILGDETASKDQKEGSAQA